MVEDIIIGICAVVIYICLLILSLYYASIKDYIYPEKSSVYKEYKQEQTTLEQYDKKQKENAKIIEQALINERTKNGGK